MVQLAWRASLVVVLLLLASVGTASAECAWVLWARVEVTYRTGAFPPRPRPADIYREIWEPRSGYDSRKECEEATKDTRGVLASILVQYPLSPGARLDPQTSKPIADDQLPTPTLYTRCLPDTIDLRGPKGK